MPFPPDTPEQRPEIACGTGLLTNCAALGLDASAEPLAGAGDRHGNVPFFQAIADDMGLQAESFDAVCSFLLLMYPEPAVIQGIFREVCRILNPGGRFIFDVPPRKHRRLLRRRQASWHGGMELSAEDVRRLCGDALFLRRSFGVLFLPVHKLPEGMRGKLQNLDYRMANGWMKETSSYLVFELVKQG